MKKLDEKTWAAICTVQEALLAGVALLDEAASTARDHHNGRSRRWQESDAGERYTTWLRAPEHAVTALTSADEALDEVSEYPEEY